MRLATAACMQKYGNVSFVTVACAKCMRYGGGGGGPYHWGGGVGIRDPDSYIYVCNLQKGSNSLLFFQMVSVSAIGLVRFFLRVKSKQGRNVQ